jgi:serine/threonine-protein phosphatase 6 regulatory subunit 1
LNKQGGPTIEELLQEEETISECKALNSKLLEFLCQPQNMSKLVKYITLEPQDPSNKDKTYK